MTPPGCQVAMTQTIMWELVNGTRWLLEGWIVGMGCSSSDHSSPIRLSMPIELGFHVKPVFSSNNCYKLTWRGNIWQLCRWRISTTCNQKKNVGVILLICQLCVCLVLKSVFGHTRESGSISHTHSLGLLPRLPLRGEPGWGGIKGVWTPSVTRNCEWV